MQKTVNVDVWFDRVAFQPAQAIFGIASGGDTGRGLGLGFAEVIPVADSDYIYAAIGEELGLAGRRDRHSRADRLRQRGRSHCA